MTIEKIVKQEKKTLYRLEDEVYLYTFESFKHYFDASIDTQIEWRLAWYDYDGYHERREYFRRKKFMQDQEKFFTETASYKSEIFKTYSVPYYVKEYEEIFVKNRPYIRYQTLLLPQLKRYGFAKVVSPMQAFQEISMYLGQLDLAEDNTVKIDDKYLAQGKGFDCYSFKKMPSKRREKKC